MKLSKILLEQEKLLIPRRTKGRAEKYERATQKKIQQYIENGSIGNLELGDTTITSLPDNLKSVGGYLNLQGTPIKSLSDNLKSVGGYLNLQGTPIESLPDTLEYVGGDLDLESTPITSLPDNLEIDVSLVIENTSIESLPKNLRVRKYFWIKNTPLAMNYTDEEIKELAYIGGDIIR